jgi:hypothetical protein
VIVHHWVEGASEKISVHHNVLIRVEWHYVRPRAIGGFLFNGSFERPTAVGSQLAGTGVHAMLPPLPTAQARGWILQGTAHFFPPVKQTMLSRVSYFSQGPMDTKVEEFHVVGTVKRLFARPLALPADGAQMPDAPPPCIAHAACADTAVEIARQEEPADQEVENEVEDSGDSQLRRSLRLRRRASQADEPEQPRKRHKVAHDRT